MPCSPLPPGGGSWLQRWEVIWQKPRLWPQEPPPGCGPGLGLTLNKGRARGSADTRRPFTSRFTHWEHFSCSIEIKFT